MTISCETKFFLKENDEVLKTVSTYQNGSHLLRPLSFSRDGKKSLKHQVHVIMYKNRTDPEVKKL